MLSSEFSKKIYFMPQPGKVSAQAKGLLLSKAIAGFVLACRARHLSEHTLTDYTRTLKRFLTHVGDTPICQITTTQVSAFLAAQPYSAKTILNYHIGLAALWTWAIREGYTERHIPRLVERPKPQQIVVSPFTEAEIRAMMASTRQRNGDRDKSVILLLLDTGLRASELCNLERKDIDLANRRLKVLGKGNKERLLPFSPRTSAALFKHLSAFEGQPFPFSRTSLARLIRDIGKRAGVDDAHPHRFRHTFAVTYLRNGGNPYTLQTIIGHTTMEMVKKYLALAQVDIEEAHRRASPVENWKL